MRSGNAFSRLNFRANAGFTLVELLVVIAIISILSIFVLLTLDPIGQIQKANDGRRKSDLSEMKKALEIYYQDHQRYPTASGNAIYWGSGEDAHKPYISAVPTDPVGAKRYIYWVDEDNGGQKYVIYASLDRGANDPLVCSDEVPCENMANRIAVDECGGSGCNYGVASPGTDL